jgi:hypothetical protein
MLGHIQDAMLPKEAWDSLVKLFAVNTKARKLQLKTELNTLEKGKMSVNEYALKIKSICESLASINVKVEDDDKVEICLRGLGPKYKSFKTSILTRDNIPSFPDLVSMLVVEERNQMDDVNKGNLENEGQALYNSAGRGRGRGRGRFGSARTNNNDYQGRGQLAISGRNNNRGRGSNRGRGKQTYSNDNGCWYCEKPGHTQFECYKKQNDEKRGKRQQNNYASTSEECDKDGAFVVQHETTAMAKCSQRCNEEVMWYVDSGASNHMTGHKNWFESLREPEIPGYIQTGDNTTHQIEHVGDIPLWEAKGKTKYMFNVMHVPNLAKNLISVGQIMEQGMQVKFKQSG